MPVYQYACTECGEELEARQSFTDDALTVCPACSGRLRKVLTAVGVVFKGSGFYRNDSRASAQSGESGESGGSGESGTTTTTGEKSSSGKPESGSTSTGSGESGSAPTSDKGSGGKSSSNGGPPGKTASPKGSAGGSKPAAAAAR